MTVRCGRINKNGRKCKRAAARYIACNIHRQSFWNNLPPEIRLQIYPYLSEFELLKFIIVDKRTYREGVPFLYAEFTISIESDVRMHNPAKKFKYIKNDRLEQFGRFPQVWNPPIRPANFDMIQHLRIKITLGLYDIYDQCDLVRQVVARLLAKTVPCRRLDVSLITYYNPPERIVSDARTILEPFRRLRVNNGLNIADIVNFHGDDALFNFAMFDNNFLPQLRKDISSSDPPPSLSPICAVYLSIAAALEIIGGLRFWNLRFDIKDVLHRARIAREDSNMEQMELIVQEIEEEALITFEYERQRQGYFLAEIERARKAVGRNMDILRETGHSSDTWRLSKFFQLLNSIDNRRLWVDSLRHRFLDVTRGFSR